MVEWSGNAKSSQCGPTIAQSVPITDALWFRWFFPLSPSQGPYWYDVHKISWFMHPPLPCLHLLVVYMIHATFVIHLPLRTSYKHAPSCRRSLNSWLQSSDSPRWSWWRWWWHRWVSLFFFEGGDDWLPFHRPLGSFLDHLRFDGVVNAIWQLIWQLRPLT